MTNIKDIQKNAIKTFKKNLQYFKQEDSSVYQKIVDYKVLLEKNEIQSRYSLEYLDCNFDLLNIKTGQYFYEQKLDSYNKKTKDMSNLSSTSNVIHTIPFEIFDKKYLKTNTIKKDTQKSIDVISKIIKKSKKEKDFTQIHKFIFLGTLLGTHLPKVHEKINSNNYLIIEPDIEIFYLSLFTTKYYNFARDSKKIFSIMDSNEVLLEKLHMFYTQGFNKNYSIKYCLATQSYSYLFNSISISLGRIEGLSFSYISYLKILKRTIAQVRKKNNIFGLNKGLNLFDNKPVLIVAPGPSLQKNIKWLKKYSNRFVVVSLSQTLKRLISEDIIPDVVTIVDADKIMYKDFEGVHKKVLDKIILLSNVNVYKKITSLFKKQNLFLYEKEIILKPDISSYMIGATVGETTYQLCLRLKAKEIYLLGTDLCIDKKSGKTHDDMHSVNSNNKLDMSNVINHTSSKKINQEKDLLKVKGNFEEEVYTTTFFNRIISYYNSISTRYMQKDQSVMNLSN